MKRAACLFLASLTSLLALENPGRKPTPPLYQPGGRVAPLPVFTPAPELKDPEPFTNNPDGAGLAVAGADEELQLYTTLSVTFPAEMVPPDKIDALGVDSPIVIWPALDAEFTWQTQTQGSLQIKGPLIPAQAYHFRLRKGLKDLAGNPLPESAWGVEMPSRPFEITEENYGERGSLNASPQVPLEFNYPIRLDDAARGVWFQDRATRQRFPAEILLNVADGETDPATVVDAPKTEDDKIYGIRIRPLDPLPLGRFYDLVVEGVRDECGGRGLAYPRVFPLGPTRPLEIDYVAARNYPLMTPFIEVKFASLLSDDPLPADALSISPRVANLKLRKDGQYVIAEGDFDTSRRYTVTVSKALTGVGGYGLAQAQTWGATFRPKEAAIIFPDRTLRERSALGLRFAFYQQNTGPLEWKLSPVPLDKLPALIAREREFDKLAEDANGDWQWTPDGMIRHESTELFTSSFGLNAVAAGAVPEAGEEKEILREISWMPPQPGLLGGPMLLEISGTDARGRVVGNRALLYFGEAAITRKTTPTQTILRVARMSDGQPAAGAKVTVLDESLKELAAASTGADGLAVFDQTAIPKAAYFLAEVDGAQTLQPVWLSDQFSSGSLSARPPPLLRAFTFTDRPLYRPGQEIHFKGMVREAKDGALKIPSGAAVKWSIERGYGGEVFDTGSAKVDANGGWSGAWTPPEDGPVGEMVIKTTVEETRLGVSARFRVEEFRNPPFSVVCEGEEAAKPAEAAITVQSQYFHGAPNAGASVKWTAVWVSDSDGEYYNGDDDMKRVDLYSEHAPRPSYTAEVSGETALDGNGHAVLRCDPPFKDTGNRARCYVNWKVEVTGPDGQTITGGTSRQVDMAPVLLGVKSGSEKPGALSFTWDARTPFGEAPAAVQAELFHVVTKSVKERLAPNVYRYRNFDQFVPVEKLSRATAETLEFRPKEPGRYVLLVSPLAGAPGMAVSEEAYLSGDEPSEVPVQSETAARVFSLNGRNGPDDKPWKVGETAVLNVLSPTGGVAWVSVESDRMLDTFTVPVQGNTTRIEIPVKPEYEPNVFVSVYLLRPGGSDQLAGEMFGYTDLAVIAPDRRLDIAVKVDRPQYEPREKVTGQVAVTAAGQPVAGADLALYAVDDSILELGGWQLPSFLAEFFPARSFAVVTWSALRAYVDKIAPSWLTMKGFVIGDGGEEEFGNVAFTRKEFKPIILWQPSVRTGADGVAKFSCDAPDNLTRFRVIAVGQSRGSQFGAGDATFAVTKNLMVDPALPRFVREGDEVELRAVVRQKVSENEKLLVRCAAGGGLELLGEPRQEIAAPKDAPVVVRFKARTKATGPATAKFEVVSASQPKLSDSVEVTLPVAEPVILKKESVAGTVGNTAFAVREVAPGEWENARGTFTFAISTTPWLAKLMGLPYLLEYPHGCFEQKTSRLLAYTYLGNLLGYLPDSGARKENYGHVIDETLSEIEASLLPGGMVPFWPQGVEPNDYVTIQTAWCVAQAEQAGFEVPERLASELPETLQNIVARKARPEAPATLRAFALFVLSLSAEESDKQIAAAAEELCLQRDKLTGEGRAMLAIALHRLHLAPEKQAQILSELPDKFDDIAFQPGTFASATRTEALCLWARLLIAPGDDAARLKERLGKLMESSASLSTQENLWLLVAFDALLQANSPAALRAGRLSPRPQLVSANGSAAAWTDQDIARLADFVVKGLPAPKPPGSFVLSAAYRGSERLTPLESRGMRIERVVKNLTDASRTGTPEKPFKLGDQLLISYRFSTDKPQSYVAVEDLLPGGVEVVNPDLALFGKYYSVPGEPGVNPAPLSHSEMRDQQTNLYFDHLSAGTAGYSVLARATAAGTFIWPATQMQPMYDSRFLGRSPSSVCVVTAE